MRGRIIAVVAAGVVLGATAVQGEEHDGAGGVVACGEHALLVAALSERYREEPVSMGLQNNGHLLEVFASSETGSWTILSTATDGKSCVLAVGEHFEQRPLAPAGPSAHNAPPPDDERTG